MWINLLCGIIALMVAIGLGRFVYTPMIPIMIEQAHVSVQTAGFIASINYVGYMIGALTPLFWSGEGVRQTAIRAGLVMTVLGFLLMSVSIPSTHDSGVSLLQLSVWGAARLINGIGSAWILINVSSILLQRLALAGRLSLMGWIYAGIGLGALVGTWSVKAFDALELSWRQDWRYLALLSFALAVPVWWVITEPKADAADHAGQVSPRFSDINEPMVWALAAAYACKGFSYIIVMTFLPLMLNDATGIASHSWTVLLLVSIPSTMCWGWLSAIFGNIRCLKLAFALQMCGVLSPVFIPGSTGILMCAILVGATFLGIVTMSLAQAQLIKPHASTMTMGLITGVYSVGQFIGPGFAGWLAQISGHFQHALGFSGVLLFVGVFLLGCVHRLYLKQA